MRNLDELVDRLRQQEVKTLQRALELSELCKPETNLSSAPKPGLTGL